MSKPRYLLALGCYLAIPVAMLAGARLARLIDPEMARSHADYVRDYRLLELARTGVLAAAAGAMLVLWLATFYLVLSARQRSLNWLALAAFGPFGFMFVAMLGDRAPAPADAYQRFIGKLKVYWRVPFEAAVFVAVWILAYQAVVLLRELMIRYQSFTTGTPAATIIAEQNASGGMWAFGEALEAMYLAVLISLLWPIAFNLVHGLLEVGATPAGEDSTNAKD